MILALAICGAILLPACKRTDPQAEAAAAAAKTAATEDAARQSAAAFDDGTDTLMDRPLDFTLHARRFAPRRIRVE